ALRTLPLPAAYRARFIKRLNSNLARRLGSTTSTVCPTSLPAKTTPFRERWRTVWTLARLLSRTPDNAGIVEQAGKPFRFLTALGIALVFPRHAQTAASFRECRDIALNLIFLSEAIHALLPHRVALAGAAGGALPSLTMDDSGSTHTSSKPQRKGRRGA